MSVQKKKIDVQRAGKFILFILMVHFLFFGYLANIYLKESGIKALHVYLSFFDRSAWLSLFIFILIFTLQAFSNDLLADGIKLNLILLGFLFLSSIFWHGVYIVGSFSQLMTDLFSIHLLVNIIVLLVLTIGCSLLGGYLKATYRNFMINKRGVEL